MVGIGVGGNIDSFKKFADDYGVTTNVLMASGGGVWSKYIGGSGSTPTSILTDAQGNEIKRWGSIRNFQDVLNAIP